MHYRGFYISDDVYKDAIDKLLIYDFTLQNFMNDKKFEISNTDVSMMTKLRLLDKTGKESCEEFANLLINQINLIQNTLDFNKACNLLSNVLLPTLSELPNLTRSTMNRQRFKCVFFSRLTYLTSQQGVEAAYYAMYDFFPEFMTRDCHVILRNVEGKPIFKTSHPIYDWHKKNLFYLSY